MSLLLCVIERNWTRKINRNKHEFLLPYLSHLFWFYAFLFALVFPYRLIHSTHPPDVNEWFFFIFQNRKFKYVKFRKVWFFFLFRFIFLSFLFFLYFSYFCKQTHSARKDVDRIKEWVQVNTLSDKLEDIPLGFHINAWMNTTNSNIQFRNKHDKKKIQRKGAKININSTYLMICVPFLESSLPWARQLHQTNIAVHHTNSLPLSDTLRWSKSEREEKKSQAMGQLMATQSNHLNDKLMRGNSREVAQSMDIALSANSSGVMVNDSQEIDVSLVLSCLALSLHTSDRWFIN